MLKKQLKIKITEDDKPLEVFIRQETYDVIRKLRIVRATEYHKLIKEGVATRAAMLELLKKEGYWTDKEEDEMSGTIVQLGMLEQALEVETDEVKQRDIVIRLMKMRNKLLELIQIKTEPIECTAEVIAEDLEREYYLIESTFYKDGRRYFRDYTDFKARRDEPNVQKIHTMFVKTLNLPASTQILELPEHRWLVSHKLMSKEGDLLDQELIAAINETNHETPKQEVTTQ